MRFVMMARGAHQRLSFQILITESYFERRGNFFFHLGVGGGGLPLILTPCLLKHPNLFKLPTIYRQHQAPEFHRALSIQQEF